MSGFSNSSQEITEFFSSISIPPFSHKGLSDVTGLTIFVGAQGEAQDGIKLV